MLAHNSNLNHLHLQDRVFAMDEYDDRDAAFEFFKDAKVYKDLPFSHSNTCPNLIFQNNCVKKGVPIVYSENQQKCAVCMAIMDCEGKVLLTRRPEYMRKFPWAWVMPGGHIEPGESLEDSVIREI